MTQFVGYGAIQYRISTYRCDIILSYNEITLENGNVNGYFVCSIR